MTYNGWTNWETWQVPLWIDNEYTLYQVRMAQERREEWTAKTVEYFARSYMPDGTPDMDSAADYDAVNWTEIAENWNYDREEESYE